MDFDCVILQIEPFNPIKPGGGGGGGLFVPAAFSFVDNFWQEAVMGLKFYDFSYLLFGINIIKKKIIIYL